ncbi:MAG: TonB-dependent receptor [Desulfovibrio sp.]|jgi:hemoglobin/transferrin/lactoferrin receptor protein|nr:TonB-dependent receptor [Desulfovibrio sp.]
MNIRSALACLLGILACALPARAAGEGDAVTLDPIIVTARGYAASQSDTPGGVAVASQEDIVLAPRGSLADSLGRLPGISRTGDSPWGQDISVRGLSGPSVVILLDGKRLNTATDMNARLGFINPADVERIEVLKGPISALYGSGSIGGGVNIITRKPGFSEEVTPHGKLAATGSTNPGGGGGYGSFSLSGPRAWAFVSGAFRDYGEVFGGHDSRVGNSDFMDRQGRAMLGLKPWDPLTITMEALHSTGRDIGIPGGVSSMPALAKVTYPSSEFTFLSLDASLEVNGAYLKTLEGSLYYTENKRRVLVNHIPPTSSAQYPNAYPLELRPSADHETWGGKLQASFELGDHTLVGGADFWTWSVESSRQRSMFRIPGAGGPITFSDSPTPDATQVSVGLFAEDNWKLNSALTLNLGARLDFLNTRADPLYNVSPVPRQQAVTKVRAPGKLGERTDEDDIGWHLHAGLTWKMDEAWSQSLLLASSYRAADVMERFKYIDLGGGQILLGNPELDPEQTIYAEYGLHYDRRPFRADLRLFANIVTDYIAERAVDSTTRVMDNVDDARIYGAELEARWQFLDDWGLFGNLTGLYSRDENTGRALPGVAPVSGRTGIDFSHGSGFWARADTFLLAPQRHTPDDVTGTKGVITLNAAAGYRFETGGLKHDISLVIDNILDTRYSNYLAHQRGYTIWEPGIAASLNYSVEF